MFCPSRVQRVREGAPLHWLRSRDPALQDCHPTTRNNSSFFRYLPQVTPLRDLQVGPPPQPDSTPACILSTVTVSGNIYRGGQVPTRRLRVHYMERRSPA